MKKVAVLYSGGMDSLVTSHLYLHKGYDVILIHFNYGQVASSIEREYTYKYADSFGLEVIEIDAQQLFSIFKDKSNLLGSDKREDVMREAEADSNYVPMRNLILLSYAAAICEINNIDRLAYGANLTESGNYPDNSTRFFYNLKNTLEVAGRQGFRLKLRAPLINLTKSEIVALAYYIKAPIKELSFSCYYPINGKPCNKCGSCYLRNKAFERAKKINGKVIYETAIREM